MAHYDSTQYPARGGSNPISREDFIERQLRNLLHTATPEEIKLILERMTGGTTDGNKRS
jgi:hypothetical protein